MDESRDCELTKNRLCCECEVRYKSDTKEATPQSISPTFVLNPAAPEWTKTLRSDSVSTTLSSEEETPIYPFKSSVRTQDMSLGDSEDDLVSFATELLKTQEGSKKAQHCIIVSSPDQLLRIVRLVLPRLQEYMLDPYANYMCQTLVQSCSVQIRLLLIKSLSQELVRLSVDPISTHVVQMMVALTSLPEEEEAYSVIFGKDLVALAKDQYGTHVIQKLITSSSQKNVWLVSVVRNLKELAMDRLGLGVVKRCISEVTGGLDRQVLKQELLGIGLLLIQDPYGNYAIQHMLATWEPEFTKDIFRLIRGKVVQLSLQKYSSNVVEKCFKLADQENLGNLLEEIKTRERLTQLLNSVFGSFVLRTAASVSSEEWKRLLKTEVNVISGRVHIQRLGQVMAALN